MVQLFVYTVIGIGILYLLVCLGYYLFQEKIIFHPQKIAQDYVYQYAVPFEEFFLTTPDGASLNLLHAKADEAKGVVLYFHGNGAHLFELADMTAQFVKMGYDVLLMDYRSYGKSSGKLSEKILHQDARLCYDWLLDHYAPEEISIYGRSIGTGVATHLAAEVAQKRLVLEAPYFSLIDLGKYYTPFLPYRLLVRYPLLSGKYIKKVTAPVSIIHGVKDKTVPFASGKKLAEAAPNLAKLYELPLADHNDLHLFDGFYEALEDIFE